MASAVLCILVAYVYFLYNEHELSLNNCHIKMVILLPDSFKMHCGPYYTGYCPLGLSFIL